MFEFTQCVHFVHLKTKVLMLKVWIKGTMKSCIYDFDDSSSLGAYACDLGQLANSSHLIAS